MTNNLSVTFAAFAGGILGGLGTIYVIGWNGVLIGVVADRLPSGGHEHRALVVCRPHRSLEIPAILLAGAAGLRLAQGLLFPGLYRRGHSLAVAAADAARLLAGTIPMLVVAGTIEGFFSPSAAPVVLKFTVGALLFAALLTWLFLAGQDREPVPDVAIAQKHASGAEARIDFAVFAARLKSCPDTKLTTPGVFPQPVKPALTLRPLRRG